MIESETMEKGGSSTSVNPVCLSIAGLDPSGGAGTIADVKTFFAFGCYPAAAVTSITFQNTVGVFGAEAQSAEVVRSQVEPILDDLNVAAVKTGMLPTREVIEEVERLIGKCATQNIIVDPVVRSTSGFDLIDNDALDALKRRLFPLAELITPNLPEAERISGIAIENDEDVRDAAHIMKDLGARNVLIKGGHFRVGDDEVRLAVDHLFIGEEYYAISGPYHETTATHGTGCTLSSAIAARMAMGDDLIDAVRTAKEFVNEAIRTAPGIGRGHSPINIKPI
jgi:hydroxymethylpyrimidine/phosphomethylpyrimidine kinase